MKKLIILIWTLIVVILMSCNDNDVQNPGTQGDIKVQQLDIKIQRPLEGNNPTPIGVVIANLGYTAGFHLTNTLANERNLGVAKPGQRFDLPKKLHRDYSWQEADEILMREFQKVIGNDGVISDEERSLTKDIQYRSLIMLNQLGKNPNSGSTGISESAANYIKILYRHKGDDLNRMADALVLAKPALDNDEFEEIKHYLIEKADEQTAVALERFDRYNQKYNAQVDKNEKRKYFNSMLRLKSMTDEASYVREVLADIWK